MPSFDVICSIGSAFRMGSFRVVILKPCWVIELPASAADGNWVLSPARPLTAIMGIGFGVPDVSSSEYKRSPIAVEEINVCPTVRAQDPRKADLVAPRTKRLLISWHFL